jgi:hypothetical protein
LARSQGLESALSSVHVWALCPLSVRLGIMSVECTLGHYVR